MMFLAWMTKKMILYEACLQEWDWYLLIGFITNLLVCFAVPPIPGGAVMGFTVVFTQLGIPMEMMAVAIAINAIPDFPATAIHTSGWQLALIDVADSLGMLEKETLRKNN